MKQARKRPCLFHNGL